MGIQSAALESGFAASFLCGSHLQVGLASSSSSSTAAWLPSTPITSSGGEARILGRDGQRLGWETAHSEALSLAFGFFMGK